MKYIVTILIFCCMTALGGEPVPPTRIALTDQNCNFLIKLTSSSMNSASSKPGDKITGVVIDPVPLRGGRVVGTVDQADHAVIRFSFNTLNFEGETYQLESVITSIVNSKGNAGQDDLGQRIRMDGGVVAYGTMTAINEGAEIRFVAWEK